ncbi:acetyl-CoA carboxylase biotin carboxyl carrier protein subunit [Zeaxanthinibacter sp. PT1]|uniref:acetyl-CoA carboxylase biotin carboxyl carrier protein subunit n=1 Tax=Zeaxanthinibacter TaxID=561554 RepID=UPI002349FA75|nr:acetyl-CoA carboxylase biotin carboxyl carrier protein subunit [Zeaxanthinibacter sp. PT1]MDC6351271.1 acetyl-CoA carboxylase biotin carboxyl carrier protein subunit [Zeaxanthinibacter sp. PT1]
MTNYRITVGEQQHTADAQDAETLDIIKTGPSTYHLLKEQKAYRIELIHADYPNKTLKIAVNGTTYELSIEDEYDQRVKEMGLLAVASQKVNFINAPMPGLILDVMVKEGQEITEGTPLLVLSAMKMENIIVSQGDGVVKSIPVKKDEAVEKGQLVIEME